MRSINNHLMAVGLTVALIATACGSDPKTAQQAGPAAAPTAAATATAAVETTAAETTEVATTTGQAGDGDQSTYATKAFNLPFDINVPAWLPAAPAEEHPNFVTWVASDSNLAVRVLIPVNVYPPGGGDTIPPPKDYLAYLLGQADHGAHFTDTTNTTVGGRPATIMTATVDDSLDGSLGCPEEGITAHDCFGLQPDLVLRIAVIDTGDKTLLIWLRNDADNRTETEQFEQMLTTVRFNDRPVEAPTPPPPPAPPAPVATPLDGTYRWTITKDDALTHGTPGDKEPENLATYPNTFTITMNDGTWHLSHRASNGDGDDGGGVYTIDGDQVVFDWDGNPLAFTYSVDDAGNLHLEPQLPMPPGDQFIWATNPWTKIADADGDGSTDTAAAALDGTYRCTITKEDALAHGTPNDKKPEILATFPWVFTVTLKDGTMHLKHRDSEGDWDDGVGTYTVNGDQITFAWQNGSPTSTYTFSVDDDGTLHLLVPVGPMDPGDVFVGTTKPWDKID